jgi:hypothetical protein
MPKPRKGKVVAINAGPRSRSVNPQGPAKSPQSRPHDPSEEWSEIVDTHAGFVWSSARAGQVSGRIAVEAFRLTWLRFADHFTEVSVETMEVWVQQTVVRERIRMTALRADRLG